MNTQRVFFICRKLVGLWVTILLMWLAYTILSAVFSTTANLARRIKGKHAQAVVIAWWTQLIAASGAIGLVVAEGGVGSIGKGFWLPAIGAALLTTITAVALIRAFQVSEVSLISPLFNLLPVFLLGTSYLMLGEAPGFMGLVGVVVISAGAYYINSHPRQRLLDPFRALLCEHGARLLLLVTLLWAVSTNFDKLAIRHASVATLVLFLYALIWSVLTPVVLARHRKQIVPTIRRHGVAIAVLSLASLLTLYFQTKAISGEFVSYVLAIKRIDVLLTVVAASILFHERQLPRRLGGSVAMFVGVCLIYVAR